MDLQLLYFTVGPSSTRKFYFRKKQLGHATICTRNSIRDGIAVSNLWTRNYCGHFHMLSLQHIYMNAYIHASYLPLRSRPVLGKQVCYPSNLCIEPMGLAGCLALERCAIAILTTGSTAYGREGYACTVCSWSTGRKPLQQRQTWFWDDSEVIFDPLAQVCAGWGYTVNPGGNPGRNSSCSSQIGWVTQPQACSIPSFSKKENPSQGPSVPRSRTLHL